MTMKRSNKITSVTPSDQEHLMCSKNIIQKNTLLLLWLTIPSIWSQKTEDFCILNTLILNLHLWEWKVKDLKKLKILQVQAIMLKKIVWQELQNIFYQITREMELELSIKLQDLLVKSGQTLKIQLQEITILDQTLECMEIHNITKLWQTLKLLNE